MTQQQLHSDAPNWDVLDELDSARKQAALLVSEAPDWSCLSEPSERLRDDLIGDQPLDDAYYDSSIVAAAYLKEYHVPHCIMAYCAFGELFGYLDRPGDFDVLYVRDVGAGTGAARVGLALSLLEREKEGKKNPSTIYFDAFEPSREMRAAGSTFVDLLSGHVGEIVASFDYHDDDVAGQTCRKTPFPFEQTGTQSVVTAFHLSLPYHSLFNRGDYIEAAKSARATIQSALNLVSPHIGLFTVNSNKEKSLEWAVNDPERWAGSKPYKLDDIRRDGVISDYKLPLPSDAVLLWRVSRDEEQRQAAMRAEEERRRREHKAAQRAEVERRAKAERAERERRERAERAAAERQRERREQALTYKDRGVAHAGKGEYDRAIRAYDQALRLDPNYVEAYCGRGSAYWSTRKYDRAIQDFNQALQLAPYCVRAYYGRGVVYASKGEYDGAIHAYNQALRLDPNYVEACNGRGSAYWHQGQFDQSIQDFNQALQLDPNQERTYFNRGLAYRCKGEYRRAESDFCKARTLGYDRAKVEARLAELRQERERRAAS